MLESDPDKLRALLEQNGQSHVEVPNGGVVGYASSHGLRLFAHRLIDLEPDIVTIRFGFNGHVPAWNPALRALEPRSVSTRWLLYTLADTGIGKLGFHVVRSFRIGAPEPLSVTFSSIDQFEWDVRRFAKLVEREGFELVVLDDPVRAMERGMSKASSRHELSLVGAASVAELNQIHVRWQARQREVVAELGLRYLDMDAACDATGDRWFNDDDMVHPSDYAHELTAARLLDLLERGGLIPKQKEGARA